VDSSLSISSTNSTTPVLKVLQTTGSLPAGTYKISIAWSWGRSSAANQALFDVSINGSSALGPITRRLVNAVEANVTESLIFFRDFSGINNIGLYYYGSTGTASTSIANAIIETIRVQ
jgi:hypothetical protein